MGLLIRILGNGLAIHVVDEVLPGLEISGLIAVIGAWLVLALPNAFLRPVLLSVTLPLTLLTLGFSLFAFNIGCLFLASLAIEGFVVDSFGSGVVVAVVVSLISWALTAWISDPDRRRPWKAKA